MVLANVISFLLSLAALAVALVALVLARRANSRSAAGGATPTTVMPPPDPRRAQLRVNLVKYPSITTGGSVALDYRFWISNDGPVPAANVQFEVDTPEPLLVEEETAKRLPYAQLAAGENFILCSRVSLRSPKVFRTLVGWQNPDGEESVKEFWISRETEDDK